MRSWFVHILYNISATSFRPHQWQYMYTTRDNSSYLGSWRPMGKWHLYSDPPVSPDIFQMVGSKECCATSWPKGLKRPVPWWCEYVIIWRDQTARVFFFVFSKLSQFVQTDLWRYNMLLLHHLNDLPLELEPGLEDYHFVILVSFG